METFKAAIISRKIPIDPFVVPIANGSIGYSNVCVSIEPGQANQYPVHRAGHAIERKSAEIDGNIISGNSNAVGAWDTDQVSRYIIGPRSIDEERQRRNRRTGLDLIQRFH